VIDEGKPDLVVAFAGGPGTADLVHRGSAAESGGATRWGASSRRTKLDRDSPKRPAPGFLDHAQLENSNLAVLAGRRIFHEDVTVQRAAQAKPSARPPPWRRRKDIATPSRSGRVRRQP
jgi:hypothetical protein